MKFHVFSKVILVDKIMQSADLCVIFHFKPPKITISCGFKLISNSYVKSKMAAKMATIVGDVTGLQQCLHP